MPQAEVLDRDTETNKQKTSGERRHRVRRAGLSVGGVILAAASLFGGGVWLGNNHGHSDGVREGQSQATAQARGKINQLTAENNFWGRKYKIASVLGKRNLTPHLVTNPDGTLALAPDKDNPNVLDATVTLDQANPRACEAIVKIAEPNEDLILSSEIGGQKQDLVINGPQTMQEALRQIQTLR